MFYQKPTRCFYRQITLLLLAILLTACGGDSTSTPQGSTANSSDNQSTPTQTSNSGNQSTPAQTNNSGASSTSTPTPPSPPPAQSSTKRILPLGDSITNGGNGFASYRRSLWFMLRNAGNNVDFIGSQHDFAGPVDNSLRDFDLDHEGHWAWEAGNIEQNLAGWLNGYTPDIVLLHAGTNDVDRNQSHDSTIGELGRIIDLLRNKNPNVVVLVAKIIPMKQRDTSDFNQFIDAFAASKNTATSPVSVVDQYSGYSAASDNYDNWHPNNSGEEKMATQWFNGLQPYL